MDAVDGFCEGIAFSPDQIARVFDAAAALGLPVKLHAEQLSDLGGTKLASSYGALSADHLEYLDVEGVAAMATQPEQPPFCCLERFTLCARPKCRRWMPCAPAMCPIALATDCNPGSSPLTSLLLTMNMGATLFQMTPLECLAGVTRNAARALGLADRGEISAGMRADLAVWDVEHPAELAYRIGFNPLHRRIFGGRDLTTLTLTPGQVTLAELERVYREEASVKLDRSCEKAVERAASADRGGGRWPSGGLRRQHRFWQTRQCQDRGP